MVQGALRPADIGTTSAVYIHLDEEVLSEGIELLTAEIFGTVDPVVTQNRELVS